MGPDDLLAGFGVGLGLALRLELGLGEGAASLGLGPEGLRRRSAAATEEGREAAAFARVLGPLLRPSVEAGAASRARRPPAALRRACAGALLERCNPATSPAGSVPRRRRRGPGQGEGEF